MGLAASPFIIDDAIIRLAQPLAQAPNQLASGPRRAGDLIEELARGENFHLNLTGSSSGRAARAVFHNAHFPDKLPGANRAEKDGIAIEFSEYVDGATEQAKNAIGRISLCEEDLPFGEMHAGHHNPFNWQQKFADDAWACAARAVRRTRPPPAYRRSENPHAFPRVSSSALHGYTPQPASARVSACVAHASSVEGRQ